jgi:hypothetical protein
VIGFGPATGNMNIARDTHGAVLLPDGRGLIIGGFNLNLSTAADPSLEYVAPSELYDPSAGAFSLTGAISSGNLQIGGGRTAFTATALPNGKVLVAGGFDSYNGSGVLGSAQLYDPTTGTFSFTVGNMYTSRFNHTATLLPNGQVLVAGGINGSFQVDSTAELYDPSIDIFTATGSMTSARDGATAALLPNGKVLIAGGVNGSNVADSTAELYDPSTGAFSATGNMTSARAGAAAILLNTGKVLIVGGNGASAELYDPTAGTFSATGSLLTARSGNTATLLNNGQVLVAGGGVAGSSIELYDPAAGTFGSGGGMIKGRFNHTATLLTNGQVLVAGGDGATGVLASAELYVPDTLTPSTLTSIAVTPANPSVSAGQSQRFVATDQTGQQLSSVAWSSSNTAVAIIGNDGSDSGVAFGVAAGASTIQACAGTICNSTTLTVPPASNTYTQLPAPSTGTRCCMGMVFVPSDMSGGASYTLVFGGANYGRNLADTWMYQNGTWTPLAPPSSPSARSGPGLAYDAVTKTVVLFGGNANGVDFNDTWIWNGATWSQASPTNIPTGRRWDTQGMAQDPGGHVVMFGGVNAGGNMFGDTWLWDGANWNLQSPATDPAARRVPLVYDPATGTVVLFGGEGSYGGPTYGDTWIWNGSSWTQVFPATSPLPRSMASMAFDSVLGRLVLFGGSQAGSGDPDYNDAWAWDGANWAQLSPVGGPVPARYAFGMVYDPSAGLLMYGGLYARDTTLLSDMWQLAP